MIQEFCGADVQARTANTTLAQKAYLALRHDIVRGEWKPGEALRMGILSKRYDMGLSPIREALSRLQSENLVVLAPLKGFSVARLSLEEMWDVVNLRILIECEALRNAIAKGGDDWQSAIVSSLHSLSLQSVRSKSGNEEDLWELEARHLAFHSALISACGSRRTLELFGRLYVESERYRIPIMMGTTAKPSRDIHAEHTEIAQAALAKDTQLACRLLAQHYQRTAEAIQHHAAADGIQRLGASPSRKLKRANKRKAAA